MMTNRLQNDDRKDDKKMTKPYGTMTYDEQKFYKKMTKHYDEIAKVVQNDEQVLQSYELFLQNLYNYVAEITEL